MKVVFKTNVDNYKTNCWPDNIEIPPRKGDMVMVNQSFVDYYASKKLPTRMEVVDVTWSEKGVVCELWFTAIDVAFAKAGGVKLF